MNIEIETPGDDAYKTLNESLVTFNRSKVEWRTDTFTVALRDGNGALRGGAHGVVRMGAVEIRGLWLDEALRRRGLGERTVRAVEEEAHRRGAGAALLDTYEFQARGFYERLGYTCFGSFAYPNGTRRFYLSRTLRSGGGA